MRKVFIGLLSALIVVLLIEHLMMSSIFSQAFHQMGVPDSFVEATYGDYDEKLSKLEKSPEVYKKAIKELNELTAMPGMSPQAAEIRNYLDWLFDLPWVEKNEVEIDLAKARKVLDTDHYGLEKVKEHILEYLAVQKRTPNSKPPILCFVGPPGVGKTTLAKSIAEATGRKFVRVAMGGVRDEAAVRGFLRTYTASKPGRIIQGLKEAGSMNPIILLDEIDKMSGDGVHGDPSAALLEVLDPSQNDKFKDHFMEIPVDLSEVMFITTANSYDIPAPLLDRLEIIELSSYTLEEKMTIAKNHLLPKQMKECSLKEEEFQITDKGLETIITNYTMEAGVRQLTRTIGSLCRKAVKEISEGKSKKVVIDPQALETYLGPSKIVETKAVKENTIGLTQGLAWTAVGGRLLPIEAVILPGTGKLIQTGNLGKVQQESIMAAVTVAKTMLPAYGIDLKDIKGKDIHIHAPEAAIKKDGPSAGITITTSIISAMTKIPVRKDVCMTGEITLNGKVMAIGGLKEKLIAAHRAGIKIAIIPADNIPHLEDVPAQVKQEMKIIPVHHISEVLKHALALD